MRCIVFRSHGSTATIFALRFNFAYWPEPHCSPAFPNLRGIPPPGNMLYKRRHQAQLLTETSPSPTLQLSWQTSALWSTVPVSPLDPLAVSCGPIFKAPRQHKQGSLHFDLKTLIETLGGGVKSRGKYAFVWSDESLQYDPLSTGGLSLIVMSIIHDALQDLPEDRTADKSASWSHSTIFLIIITPLNQPSYLSVKIPVSCFQHGIPSQNRKPL